MGPKNVNVGGGDSCTGFFDGVRVSHLLIVWMGRSRNAQARWFNFPGKGGLYFEICELYLEICELYFEMCELYLKMCELYLEICELSLEIYEC